MVNESEQVMVPHDELCDGALKHYNEISSQAMHSNSLVPKAIEYYKRWRPRGERQIVRTPGKLLEALEAGWVFDPWLNTMGRPIIVGDQPYRGEHPALSAVDPREPSIYWVLVRGSPEKVARLEPFVELPEEEEAVPELAVEPYGLETMFISYGEKDSSGNPKKPGEGFVIMHKDHIYAKGTVYTKSPRAMLTAWDVAKSLAGISHLGVDEAHDVIMGIVTKEPVAA